MIVKFPPRFLHPFKSVLGQEVLRLAEEGIATNVPDLARVTGANPAVIDKLLDSYVAMQGGVG